MQTDIGSCMHSYFTVRRKIESWIQIDHALAPEIRVANHCSENLRKRKGSKWIGEKDMNLPEWGEREREKRKESLTRSEKQLRRWGG